MNSLSVFGRPLFSALAILLSGLVAVPPVSAQTVEIQLQSNFPPLQVRGAPPGGAHPIGGLNFQFVQIANKLLAHRNKRIVFHVPGKIHPSDAKVVEAPLVHVPKDFPTYYEAVAAGKSKGGVDMAIGIGNQNGTSFGELFVAGLPFGMEVDEFAGYLYGGGGLKLQQDLYDKQFAGNVIVLPMALTSTQGGGWLPQTLPDPDTNAKLSDVEAMAQLCRKPWIVRWPEPGASVWAAACKQVGAPAAAIGPKTRCADPKRACPSADNPVANKIDRLTFGGFVPGAPPHGFIANGNIDAYELNLPFTEVQMIKLATGQSDKPNGEADLTPVISRAPYYYAQTWHQPYTYVELLINRSFWNSLDRADRTIIEAAAYRATLENWAIILSYQDQGIELLRKNGAVILRWPKGLLRVLRDVVDKALDARSDNLAAKGDASYRRVLDHMRAYQARQKVYDDFGDINQGRARLSTSP